MSRVRSAIAIALLIGVGALLIAWDGEQETQAATAAPAAVEPQAGCTRKQAIERVKDFGDVLRTADLGALEVYWGGRFKWFSVTIGHSNNPQDHSIAFSPRKALWT